MAKTEINVTLDQTEVTTALQEAARKLAGDVQGSSTVRVFTSSVDQEGKNPQLQPVKIEQAIVTFQYAKK